MDKARLRSRRRSGWWHSRRGNRRVRAAGGQSRFNWKSGLKPLIVLFALLFCGSAAFGLHHFLTRSSHFAVRALRFSPTKQVTAESLAARAGEVIGANLFRVDLDEIARAVREEPWIATAHARRELPSSVVVDVTEREARVAVALGPLYLADALGNVFKRATPDEAALPVVTGVERDLYLADPETARQDIRDAVSALEAWQKGNRPTIGEVHWDKLLGITLYTVEGRVGVRLGRSDGDVQARLKRFDAVWAALMASGEKPRLIHLDNRARPDRVTVKLAPPPPPKKATKSAVDESREERDT